MLLTSEGHGAFLLKSVLVSWRVKIAMVGRASSSDKYFSSWKGAGRSVILNLAVVDGGERIAARQRTKGQYLFALPEKAYFRSHLVADLNKAFITSERHD